MEIQRQSDYYGLDRPESRQAHLTADQISALTSGPQITPGLLNTRTAWRQGDEWTYSPEDRLPEELPEPSEEEYELIEALERYDNEIPEDLVERRREGFRTAAPLASPGDAGASADEVAIAAGVEGATPNAGIAFPNTGQALNALTGQISLDPSLQGNYDGADFNPGPTAR